MKKWEQAMYWFISFLIILLTNCSIPLLQSETRPEISTQNSQKADSLILIRGVMEEAGKGLRSVEPIKFKLNKIQLERPSPDYEKGFFFVEIIYHNNKIQKIPFTAMIISDTDEISYGYFELYIPIYNKIEQISIKVTDREITLYQFDLD